MPEDRDYKKLFIVGCPRSGTTWVQLLLAQHPSIATAPETQIFAYYLYQFERQWRLEHEGAGRKLQGQAGLSRLLSDEEFSDLCRASARTVLDKIREGRPGCEVVAEKSPKHALHAAFIQRLFPDALFLHVIRDPRDTAVSLLAASKSWGRSWAPGNAVQAGRMWVEHIEHARQVANAPGQYREVMYEPLKADPVGELQVILQWLGVPCSKADCVSAVAACDFKELQQRTDTESLPLPGSQSPSGFFRRGETGGWRSDLSSSEIRVLEHICGPLMADLGYPRATTPTRTRPLKILLHDGIQRVRESIDWQLARVQMRV